MIRAFRRSVRSRRLWALAWLALLALVVNPLSAARHPMASMAKASTDAHMSTLVAAPHEHCGALSTSTKGDAHSGHSCCGTSMGDCTCPTACSIALMPSPLRVPALVIASAFASAVTVPAPSIQAGPALRPPAA